MEIESEDGSTTLLQKGLKSEFGRGLGFDPEDRTVSRRHVCFEIDRDPKSRVHFEVTGKNPIWVHKRAGDEIRIFRSSEDGEMEAGDKFCVSAKKPRWFTLKRAELEGEDESEAEAGESANVNELAESLQSSHGWKGLEGLDVGSVDVSDIDPVKDFGFLVIGHEFDHYSKRISQPKSWHWFLEEPKEESEEDESIEKKGKKRARRKGKKDETNDDDDEWTAESEEDKELLAKSRKVQKPKYSTRSKDSRKPVGKRTSSPREEEEDDEDDEDEDEEDETLGGFIVTDEDAEQEEEIQDDEEDDFEEEDEDE